MKDPGKPKMHYPEKQRNIPEKAGYRPENMDKSMKGYSASSLEEGHDKHPMPNYFRAKMPTMKP